MSPPLLGLRIPCRELVTLRQYVSSGSYKDAAWELGISESTARQRVSSLIRRLGVRNVTQAVWVLRVELGSEQRARRLCSPITDRAKEGTVGLDYDMSDAARS